MMKALVLFTWLFEIARMCNVWRKRQAHETRQNVSRAVTTDGVLSPVGLVTKGVKRVGTQWHWHRIARRR